MKNKILAKFTILPCYDLRPQSIMIVLKLSLNLIIESILPTTCNYCSSYPHSSHNSTLIATDFWFQIQPRNHLPHAS